jgi:hypothetical protein
MKTDLKIKLVEFLVEEELMRRNEFADSIKDIMMEDFDDPNIKNLDKLMYNFKFLSLIEKVNKHTL